MQPPFFQAVLAVWPILAQISTANAAAQELYTTLGGSYQMPPSSELVLNGDCAVQKGEVAKL